MNKFVESEYDQFKQKEVVRLKEDIELKISNLHMDIVEANVDFRKVILEGHSIFVMDIEVICTEAVNLSKGQLQMIIDGNHVNIPANENYSNPYLHSYRKESCWYELSDNLLKVICDASSIEMRITNGDDYAELSTHEMQWGARILYNAVVDNTMYVKEILAIGNKKEQQEYIEKHKKSLIWTWVLGVIAIVIGFICAWWLVVLGVASICVYQYCFSQKKNEIINSKKLN